MLEVGDPHLRSLITRSYNSKQVLVINAAELQFGLIYLRWSEKMEEKNCFVLFFSALSKVTDQMRL